MMSMIGTAIGSYAPDFELPGTDGDVHHLGRYLERCQAVVVTFLANQCPYVQSCLDCLKQLQSTLAVQNIALIGINANDPDQSPADGFAEMKTFAEAHQLNFPYLRDVTQDVAMSFGVKHTPTLFLVNSKSVLCYAGPLSDRPDTTSVDCGQLQQKVARILNGETIAPAPAEMVGSPIKWRR